MWTTATDGVAWSLFVSAVCWSCPSVLQNGRTDCNAFGGEQTLGLEDPHVRGRCILALPGECNGSICVAAAMQPFATIIVVALVKLDWLPCMFGLLLPQ